MTNRNIGEVLQELMDAKGGIGETELSKDTGIPQPTLHHILAGNTKKPRKKALIKLANHFSISVPQLLGHEPLTASQKEASNVRRIPVIPWDNILEHLMQGEVIQAEAVNVDIACTEKSFALQLINSSMEPYFPQGSILIVDPMKQPWNRCYVMAHLKQHNSIVFKQYLIDGDDAFLKSLNPDFETLGLTQLQPNDKIIGIVIQVRVNLED